MSGLYSSLSSTVKALTAHSRAIETAGKNLANVNNPNYARQRVIFGDRGQINTPMGPQSFGLEALGIEHVRDALRDRQLLREIGLRGSFEAEQTAYQRAQAGLGQGIDRSSSAADVNAASAKGLAAAIDDFFNAFQGFASNPTENGMRQTVLQKTAILTDRFHLADERLAQVQTDLDAKIASDVGEINRIISTIAELNDQIGSAELTTPGVAIDLRDQRQARLEELAAKISFDVQDTGGGQIRLVAKDGGGSDVVLLDGKTVPAPVAFTGTAFTAGVPSATLALTSGSIKGSLDARDGTIQTLREELDLLAEQFVLAVNSAYNPTSAAGQDFFGAGTTAATIAIDPSITPSTLKSGSSTAAGDNSIALAVARLANQTFSTSAATPDLIDGTFNEAFSNSVSKLGQALAGANARVEDQSNIERLVRSQRDAVSGVSLDEEMADLLKFQRAFQASSRVFSVIDELLETVVTRLGV